MSIDMRPLSVLILSDIHFGRDAVSDDFALENSPPPHKIQNAVPMKRNLIENLSGKNVEAILVTGDLTSAGGPSEFQACRNCIVEIAETIGVEKENIFFAFGNHDVNWPISKLSDDEHGTAIKDELYVNVAASVGHIFIQNLNDYESGPIPGSGLFCRDKFVLYVANSGYFSAHNQQYSHGKLGPDQYDWLKNSILKHSNISKWQILMLHHHPFKYTYPTLVEDISCLEEGSEIVDLIGSSNIDIVCHGHRHHPKLFTDMRTNWNTPITFFCSGSLSVNERHRRLGGLPPV